MNAAHSTPTPPYSQGGMLAQPHTQRLLKGEMSARVDWFAGTTVVAPGVVIAMLNELIDLGDTFTRMKNGLNGYHHGVIGLNGASVSWTPGRAECFVNLPGGVCKLLKPDALIAFGIGAEVSVTRIDVAVDGCPFTPHMVYQAWLDGAATSKVNRDSKTSYDWRSSPTGETFYLGSKQSDRRSRCYTKNDDNEKLYSDGTPVVRWEVQYRRGRAKQVFKQLETLYFSSFEDGGVPVADSFGGLALGLISDHVTFVDLSTHSRARHCSPSTWWNDFIGSATKIKTWVAQTMQASIERLERYIFNQVSGSLATLAQYAVNRGADMYDFVNTVIGVGETRMQPRHHALLKASQISV